MHGTLESHDACDRMRVVHVGPEPDIGGGMPAVIGQLLSSAREAGYSVDLIPTYRTAAPVSRLLIFAAAALSLARWCAGPGVRLVHVHATVRGSLYRKSACIVIAKALGRPVILHVHSGRLDIASFAATLGPVRYAWFRRALALADRRVSVARASAQELSRSFGVRDFEVLPTSPPKAHERPRRARRGEGPATALYVGGFHNPVKGGAVLARALPRILRGDPTIRMILAGPGDPPPEIAETARGDERVGWAGWLDASGMAAARRRSEIFVLPSTSEGFPVAVLEAMTAGQAIVSTTVGAVPDVLTDGVDALLVPPDDPGALADAMLRLAASPEERHRLGTAACATAERLNHAHAGRLDEIYRELCAA